jgi:hypothetical protein
MFSIKYTLGSLLYHGTGQIHPHASSFVHDPAGSVLVVEVDVGFW